MSTSQISPTEQAITQEQSLSNFVAGVRGTPTANDLENAVEQVFDRRRNMEVRLFDILGIEGFERHAINDLAESLDSHRKKRRNIAMSEATRGEIYRQLRRQAAQELGIKIDLDEPADQDRGIQQADSPSSTAAPMLEFIRQFRAILAEAEQRHVDRKRCLDARDKLNGMLYAALRADRVNAEICSAVQRVYSVDDAGWETEMLGDIEDRKEEKSLSAFDHYMKKVEAARTGLRRDPVPFRADW